MGGSRSAKADTAEVIDRSRSDAGERTATRTVAVAGTVVVLLMRLWLTRGVRFCGTPDSCSYLALAQSLSRHRGFVENFLYQYQMVDIRLPQHGIEYWRPGTSFLFLLAQPFGGVTLHGSLVIATVAGALLAAAAWRIAWNIWQDRRIACLACLLALVLPPMWDNAITPDSAVFYGCAVGWFLALFRVEFKSYGEDALAWFCVAAVSLIRNDAVLLLAPLATVLWLRRRRGVGRGCSVLYCAGALAAFGVAMLPMAAINRAVLGTGGGSHIAQAVYLTDLSELLYYGRPITLASALAHGIKPLVMLRVSTTAMIVYRFVFLMCGFAAILPGGVWLLRGEVRRRLRNELAGPAAFWIAVVAVYGLVLPAIGQFSALRSFTGVLPAMAAAMACGIAGYTGAGAGMRRLGWSALIFLAVAGVMTARRTVASMQADGEQDEAVARYLQQHGVEPDHQSLIMSADSAQFAEMTGYATIPVPSNGPAATLQAVHDLHPTHVVLELDPASNYAESIAAVLQPKTAEHIPGTRAIVLTLAPASGSR